MKVLISGGAGFIGSALIRYLLAQTDVRIVNVDCLTYAANLLALEGAEADARYSFERQTIVDGPALRDIFHRHRPDSVIHLAAESHVDRSIDGPGAFVQTNLVGTFQLLEAARDYLRSNPSEDFRFLHVSTDEVYGTLGESGLFTEDSPLRPNSPYAATKAGSDLLAQAWAETYGLPVVISNCTNNYGPWQFPEKLIPTVILKALDGLPIPIYGSGSNVRDWLHVDDHAAALWRIVRSGRVGERYNIGAACERTNLDIARVICRCLDTLRPRLDGKAYEAQLTFVSDRPGHDFRYALDAAKIADELGWRPSRPFESGMAETVRWYLDHEPWWRGILAGTYDGRRQGLTP